MKYYKRNIHKKLKRFMLAFSVFFVVCVYVLTVFAISEKSFSDFFVKKNDEFDRLTRTLNDELVKAENLSTKITSNSYIMDLICGDYEDDMYKNHNVHTILNLYFSGFVDDKTAAINDLKVYTNNDRIYEGRFIKHLQNIPAGIAYEDIPAEGYFWKKNKLSVSLYRRFQHSNEENILILGYTISYNKFNDIISEFNIQKNPELGVDNTLLFNEVCSDKQKQKNYVIADALLSDDTLTLLIPRQIRWTVFGEKAIIVFPMVVLFLLILSGLSMFITKRLTNDLYKFIEHISRDSNLTELTSLAIDEKDDMYPVYNRILSLIQQVNNLHSEINSIEDEKKIIENQYIYAQINPHLLYNALSVFKWRCMGYDQSLSDAIDMMSDYFRKSINLGNEEITFAEEIELVRSYVALMNYIREKKHMLKIELDEDILSLKTIRHIFQPLVENSILHGIRHRDDGIITIQGTIDNNVIEIKIKDNGVGIPREKLEQINSFSYDSKYNSFGVKNTQLRLQLFYNSQSGLSIDSVEGEGTTATIRICL